MIWLHVAQTIRTAEPASVQAPGPTAVAWGDRVFTSRKQLEVWLEARGLSYRAWAHNHPAARPNLTGASGGRGNATHVAAQRIRAPQGNQPAAAAKGGGAISWLGYAIAFAATGAFFVLVFRRQIAYALEGVSAGDATTLFLASAAAVLIGIALADLLG